MFAVLVVVTEGCSRRRLRGSGTGRRGRAVRAQAVRNGGGPGADEHDNRDEGCGAPSGGTEHVVSLLRVRWSTFSESTVTRSRLRVACGEPKKAQPHRPAGRVGPRAVLRLRPPRGLPPALRHRDFRRLFGGFLASGFATADGGGGGRLAGLRDPPECVRPRADRAGGVHCHSHCWRCPRARSPTGCRGCGCSPARSSPRRSIAGLLLLVTIEGARRALAVRHARGADRRDPGVRRPAGRSLTPEIVPTELLAGALALRSVAGQLATVAGPAVRRAAVRDPPRGGLRRSRSSCSPPLRHGW